MPTGCRRRSHAGKTDKSEEAGGLERSYDEAVSARGRAGDTLIAGQALQCTRPVCRKPEQVSLDALIQSASVPWR